MTRIVSTALIAALCACQMTTQHSATRQVLRSRVERSQTAGEVRLSMVREDFIARLRVERDVLCAPYRVDEGDELRTTTRTPSDPAMTLGLALVGLAATITGAWWVASPNSHTSAPGEPGFTEGGALAFGALMIGGGVAAMVPWIYTRAASGETTETVPFRAETVLGDRAACGRQPWQGVLELRRGGRLLVERRTDSAGSVSLNLAEVLPYDAFRRAQPWSAISAVASGNGARIDIDLSEFRVAIADAQWRQTIETPTPEGFERFASDFPGDARVAASSARAEVARREREAFAVDGERESRWREAGNDDERLTALLAEGLRDVWALEVTCRLGARRSSVEQLRAAQRDCAERLESLGVASRERHGDVVGAAEHSRAQIVQRIEELEQAERDRLAEAAAVQARRLRHAAAASRAALVRAREIISACRQGRSSGASAAREAYEALTQAGATSHRDDLVVRIAAACHCTPTCAGVSLRE